MQAVSSFETNPVIITNTVISAIKATLSAALDVTNTAANVAREVNTYVLQPLAFVLSGNLMKLITASVIAFVIGKTNGTGVPQFVQNLQGHMQMVGDTQASAFFAQFGRNSNSPFAAAISSSLRTYYLQNTSSAGFFAANQNTLNRVCPNSDAFLAGNWPQCGAGAWLALTGPNPNNPYILNQAAESHLASVVGGAQAARSAELDWAQGFLSWCGPAEMPTTDSGDGTAMEGTAPGDACTQSDGTPGTIKTPGSVIKAVADEAITLPWKKLAEMGSLAKEVNQILGNVGTVLATVNFASELLGGPDSGGLFGVGQTSVSQPTSRLVQYQTAPGYFGVTPGQVYQNAATLPSSGSDMSNRITQYRSTWNTIAASANAASTTVASLVNFCTTAAIQNPDTASTYEAQATAARTALSTEIAPVLAKADAAFATIEEASALVQKVQTELNSGIDPKSGAYLADLQTLQTMSPTDFDVINVQQDTQAFGQSVATPAGSLTVGGGSLIDQMSLLATNAQAIKNAGCTTISQGGTEAAI
ncbi:TPA: hypothetical protein DIV48_03470 [Candidatus Kaiserbacteria bacterium]|nr:hypothetical protein [Candidatus Kaiserbacteria bacterium]